MKIAVGSDHAGFSLKQEMVAWLEEQGHQVEDLGPFDESSCDYPIYAQAVAQEILAGNAERGLLVCGTGIGMALAANRFKGIRAVNCNDLFCARLSREHNNSNILTLGARVIAPALAKAIAEIWLTTQYQGGRHQDRLDLMDREIN